MKSLLALGLVCCLVPLAAARAHGPSSPSLRPAIDDAPVVELVLPEIADGDSQQVPAWIEYTVTGDFSGEGRDQDVVICSEGEEGTMVVAARGEWYMDFEIDGYGPGEFSGSARVSLPEALEGAPSNVFSRRMEGEGVFTVQDTGEDAMGSDILEFEFSGEGLQNDAGQVVAVSGKFVCPVF